MYVKPKTENDADIHLAQILSASLQCDLHESLISELGAKTMQAAGAH